MKKSEYVEYLLDRLSPLGPVTCRSMFGGYGLYHGGVFFGIIYKDRLYLKTDDASRAAYLERGMKPFRPSGKQTLKSYYEAPEEVVEEGDELADWARRAVRAQAEHADR